MPDSRNATFALSTIVAGLWRSVEWNQSVSERVRWIEQALALGITAFDHADIYGGYQAEALFGAALRAAPGLRCWRWLKTDHLCWFKTDQGWRPRGTPLGCG